MNKYAVNNPSRTSQESFGVIGFVNDSPRTS